MIAPYGRGPTIIYWSMKSTKKWFPNFFISQLDKIYVFNLLLPAPYFKIHSSKCTDGKVPLQKISPRNSLDSEIYGLRSVIYGPYISNIILPSEFPGFPKIGSHQDSAVNSILNCRQLFDFIRWQNCNSYKETHQFPSKSLYFIFMKNWFLLWRSCPDFDSIRGNWNQNQGWKCGKLYWNTKKD